MAIRPLARILLLGCLAVAAGCAPDSALPEAERPLPPVGTATGERIPPLSGVDPDGTAWRLDPAAAGQTLLVFYRSGGCGLCRLRLEELERHLDDYSGLGVRVVAVTPEPPPAAARTREALALAVPVVSVDRSTLVRWGILDPQGEEVLPASFLIDDRGVIGFRHVGRHAGDRARDVEIVVAARQLQQGHPPAGP